MPFPALAAAAIMGGGSMATGILKAIYEAQQIAAQEAISGMQIDYSNFQRQWEVDAANRNIFRQRVAQLVKNRSIETAANEDRAIGEFWARENWRNSRSALSKQTMQINGAIIGALNGQGIDPSSGTAKALLRQNMMIAGENATALRINFGNNMRDIEKTYKNRLAERNFDYTEPITFVPAQHITTANARQALWQGILLASLGGTTAGLQGYAMAGGLTTPAPSIPTSDGGKP